MLRAKLTNQYTMRFQASAGDAAANLTARGKHYVLFDLPADKGDELKLAYPELGWAASIEGHPTLPYSIAARLILRVGAERDNRDAGLFESFATDQPLARIWATVAPHFNFTAEDPFSEVSRVVSTLDNKDALIFVAGDWQEVEGDLWPRGKFLQIDFQTV